MPTTKTYLDNLKTQLKEASAAKRAAYESALARATTATFDPVTGKATYKTDEQGKPMYGTLDVRYMNRKRGAEVAGEQSGTLRSGQHARNLADELALYRGNIAEAGAAKEEGITQTDLDEAQKIAEYTATYGQPKTSTSSSSNRGNNNQRQQSNSGLGNTPPFPQQGQTQQQRDATGYGSRAGNTGYSQRARANLRLR